MKVEEVDDKVGKEEGDCVFEITCKDRQAESSNLTFISLLPSPENTFTAHKMSGIPILKVSVASLPI